MVRVLVIGALLASAAVCHGSVSAQSWAARLFDHNFHNFGDVARGATAEHVFTFYNSTNSTIRVSNVRASCGCTTPVIETHVVAPGEEGRIKAVYNTRSFQGRRGATITVTFSQPSWTEVQLRVDGFIRTDIVVEPGDVNFREVNSTEPVYERLFVRYLASDRWAINDIVSSNPNIDAEWREVRRANNAVEYEIRVRLDPQTGGYINDQLVLVTNDRMFREVPLVVSGYVRPMLEVPTFVDLGTIRAGEAVRHPVVIKSSREFTILESSASDPRLQVSKSDEQKSFHLLSLEVNTDEEGVVDDVIYIETDMPGAGTARIRVTGRVVQPEK